MTFDPNRLLLNPGAPDRQTYLVIDPAMGDKIVSTFITGGVNGKTADDTAIGNVADMSEQVDYTLVLVRKLCQCEAGIISTGTRWPRP